MKTNTLKKIAFLSLGVISTGNLFAQNKPEKAPSVPAKDTYFGITVEDKYRNLEDLKNEQTLSWLKAQADYTNNILNSIPGKKNLID